MKKPDCFIIAPISTPEDIRPIYRGDPNHFTNVLKQLVVPAVEKAGFTPILPIMEGSDVIHANIIRNLEQAPLVLCDISSLNANVMLELGIRTALNKPVCIIKDNITPADRVPFDLSIINNHTYNSDPTWTLVSEIDKLASHLKQSSTDTDNALWKYFALRLTAHPPEQKPGTDNRFEVLISEVAALRKDVKAIKQPPSPAIAPTAAIPIGYSGHTAYTGHLGDFRIDYLPQIMSGVSPETFLSTESGTTVGDVMSELYSLAMSSGLIIHNMYFNAGVLTIVVDPVDLTNLTLPSLHSFVASHGLQLAIEGAHGA
jgi:hypothetical protein